MPTKDRDEKPGAKGQMTVEEAGHLGGEKGGHKGGQRVRELVEEGKEKEAEQGRGKRRE